MDRGLISDQLKELFLSFSLDIPSDTDEQSFVCEIIDKNLPEFESEIKKFSDGVLLTKGNPKTRVITPEAIRVYEIEIGRGVDELIEKKVTKITTHFKKKTWKSILADLLKK